MSVAYRIPDSLFARLRNYCKPRGINMAWLIAHAIEAELDKRMADKHAATCEQDTCNDMRREPKIVYDEGQ